MRIAGFHKCSLVDYPGKLAAVVFTRGCNMDCFYCHNRRTALPESGEAEPLGADAILATLASRRGLLDGVVVSGGEPTLQPDLLGFLAEIKALGYLAKLDTNGTNPDVLHQALERGLVDYVALDLKGPDEKYPEICRAKVDTAAIRRSVDLLLQSAVDSEFRTTCVPQLDEARLRDMLAHFVGGRRGGRLYLQQFHPPLHEDGPDADNTAVRELRPHPPYRIQAWASRLDGLVGHCSTRGVA